MKKFLIIVNLIATLSCIGLGVKFLLMPMLAESVFKEEYKVLMFKCDNVMRDHLIAKNRVIYEKSEMALRQLKSAEMALISCHDYDKLRKRMKIWGVTDNELALMGLEAIEKNTKDLMKYVEIHEIKY